MAKSSHSLSPFRILNDAWIFLGKQPALLHVLFWLLILPVVLMDLLTEYWPVTEVPEMQQIGNLGYVVAQIVLTVVTVWGLACVLLVGRRMVVNRAGRSRTSFRSVRTESSRLVLPIFFTSILRSIITFEWALIAILPAGIFLLSSQECRATFSPILSAISVASSTGSPAVFLGLETKFFTFCGPAFLALPLLIPAAIYQLRSLFFAVVIASEDLRYRDALRRSRDIVRGKSWRVLWVLIAISLMLFIPAGILSFAFDFLRQLVIPAFDIVSAIADDVIYGVAGLLLTLSLVAFYGKLSKEKGRVEEVMPE